MKEKQLTTTIITRKCLFIIIKNLSKNLNYLNNKIITLPFFIQNKTSNTLHKSLFQIGNLFTDIGLLIIFAKITQIYNFVKIVKTRGNFLKSGQSFSSTGLSHRRWPIRNHSGSPKLPTPNRLKRTLEGSRLIRHRVWHVSGVSFFVLPGFIYIDIIKLRYRVKILKLLRWNHTGQNSH